MGPGSAAPPRRGAAPVAASSWSRASFIASPSVGRGTAPPPHPPPLPTRFAQDAAGSSGHCTPSSAHLHHGSSSIRRRILFFRLKPRPRVLFVGRRILFPSARRPFEIWLSPPRCVGSHRRRPSVPRRPADAAFRRQPSRAPLPIGALLQSDGRRGEASGAGGLADGERSGAEGLSPADADSRRLSFLFPGQERQLFFFNRFELIRW